MSHLMPSGRPCERSDGHAGRCRPGGYKERHRVRGRAYRQANKEQIAARGRAYYEANKERKAEYRRAYYEANREKELAQQSDYRYEREPFKVRAMRQMRDRRRKALQRIADRNERYGAPSDTDMEYLERMIRSSQ